MTDNRTTELLCKLLDERGVKYDVKALRETEWTVNGVIWHANEYDGNLNVYVRNNDMLLTPEQAIAATLGSEREKRLTKLVRIYGEIANYFCERFACCDAEFANCKYCIGLPQGGQCELGWCNDESNALGIEQPDYGGGECEPVNLQELYDRITELEELVRDWQALYENPDFGDCVRLKKRMQELGIEVIDE